MYFDVVCAAVQGRLLSFEKTLDVKLLDIGPDHTTELSKLLNEIELVIKELESDEQEAKKVHLLFLVNTDLPSLKLFDEDPNYCHFTGALPKFNFYLYFAAVNKYKWHKYMRQAIISCPEFLTYELLEKIDKNLNYLSFNNTFDFLYNLHDALFSKIILLDNDHRKIHNFVKKLGALMKFEPLTLTDSLEKNKQLEFYGYLVKTYIDLVTNFIGKIRNFEFIDDEDYKSNVKYDYSEWSCTVSKPNWRHFCLSLVSSKASDACKKISVETFMYWTEINVNDNGVEKTLQVLVRESAWVCAQAIESVAELHESVASLKLLATRYLQGMALEPITEDEEILNSDPTTIVINLLNPKKTRIKWLRGLIEKGIFESAQYVKVVTDNCSIMDYDTALLLLNKAVQYINTHSVTSEDVEMIRNLTIACVKALKLSDQLLILKRFTQLHNVKEPFLSPNIDLKLTSFYNKINFDEEKKQEVLSEMVYLVLESKDKFVKRTLEECILSKERCTLIMPFVVELQPVFTLVSAKTGSSLCYSNMCELSDYVADNDDKTQNYFIHLFECLISSNILGSEAANFVFNYIKPKIEESLCNKKYSKINFYLDITGTWISLNKYEARVIDLLVLMLHTLNAVRPKVQNFSNLAIEATNKCIFQLSFCVQKIIKLKTCEDDERLITNLAKNLNPLTWRYLEPVYNKWGIKKPENEKNLLWFTNNFGENDICSISDESRKFVVTSLVKILPVLTMREWEKLGGTNDSMEALTIFGMIADCLLILFQMNFFLQNAQLSNYVILCFVNYTKLKIKSLKKTNPTLVESLLMKTNQIVDNLPTDMSKSNIPHFQQIQVSLSL